MLNKNRNKLKKIYKEEFENAYEKAKVDELAKEINRLKEKARKDAKLKASKRYAPSVKKVKHTGKKLKATGKKVAKFSKKVQKTNEKMIDEIMGW